MQRVPRSEILDYVTYGEQRETLRAAAIEAKRVRRVALGEHLTFLFENAVTVRHQVHEMVRAEHIVREADIQHELDTYNELLGGPGELGATLLIELDEAERPEKLRAWLGLPQHIYLRLEDGTRVGATFDPRQIGDDRLSSVQYLKFPVGGRVPQAIGVDHPALKLEAELNAEQRSALGEDLRDDRSS